ncbi:uncharacterized protein LOC126892508 isoform X1 [Diabrotica virgifera virgifera]|uniref:SIAH-type domain-containing protein n=1 Tax=Diabrotica virgifera virgifera TaxID=50390 RepID=A0ABM5L6F7_DIAVI|nr:uncharacterized protein LOC126892508 isoform X1 [Diabrotica virgifera virgifera]
MLFYYYIGHNNMSVIIPDNILDTLLCSFCHKYLSVKPVKIYPNRRIQCGRCVDKQEPALQKSEGVESLYGIIAEHVLFKCVNKFDGCRQLLTYSEVRDHEQVCLEKNHRCPICYEEMTSFLMLQHFHFKHKSAILDCPTLVFNLNDYLEMPRVYIYQEDDNLFFLYISYSMSENSITLDLVCMGSYKLSQNIYHQFTLSSEKKEFDIVLNKKPCTDDFFVVDISHMSNFIHIEFKLIDRNLKVLTTPSISNVVTKPAPKNDPPGSQIVKYRSEFTPRSKVLTDSQDSNAVGKPLTKNDPIGAQIVKDQSEFNPKSKVLTDSEDSNAVGKPFTKTDANGGQIVKDRSEFNPRSKVLTGSDVSNAVVKNVPKNNPHGRQIENYQAEFNLKSKCVKCQEYCIFSISNCPIRYYYRDKRNNYICYYCYKFFSDGDDVSQRQAREVRKYFERAILSEIINGMKFYKWNCSNCNSDIQVSDMQSHEINCKRGRQFRCPIEGCCEKGTVNQMIEHLKNHNCLAFSSHFQLPSNHLRCYVFVKEYIVRLDLSFAKNFATESIQVVRKAGNVKKKRLTASFMLFDSNNQLLEVVHVHSQFDVNPIFVKVIVI